MKPKRILSNKPNRQFDSLMLQTALLVSLWAQTSVLHTSPSTTARFDHFTWGFFHE